MKRICALFLILIMIAAATACSQQAGPTETPASVQADSQNTAVVTFADPVLEAMVRAAMGKPECDITMAEAEAVTRLNLSIEWQRYVSQETPIKDIGGLENFTNLESLDLSFNAITDITPLAGLKKLTLLSLGGNPVADIAPLAGLTNLKVLVLSQCAAQDYSPLAELTNLNFLRLDHVAITDVSPLASLTSLKHLYLADCPIDDYSPLSDIYPNLEERDFTMASTLAELGFTMNDANNQASYGDVQRDGLSVNINHAEWGAPQSEDMTKCVRMDLMLDSGYTLVVLYYPEISAYVFQMNINGEQMNYIYNAADGTFMVDSNNRERFERMITEALGETDETDALLAPIPVFDDTIRETFGMTADALYALPFEQTAAQPEQTTAPYALPYKQLGFTADTAKAVCIYERQEPHYMRIAIHRPEWGENPDGFNIMFHDADINGYNLVIMYFADDDRYNVRLDKDGVDCSYDYYTAPDQYGWEYPDIATVIQMFGDAFDTQGKETYLKALPYFKQVVQERFGMSVDELYALPIR